MSRSATPVLLCALVGLAAGCASVPGLNKPRVYVEPRVMFEDVQGTLSMQSASPTGPITNPGLSSRDSFNFSRRETQIGGRIHVGDGHSGLTAEIMQQDFKSRPGSLLGDFGELNGPTTALVDSDMNGLRVGLAYHAVVWTVEESDELRLRFSLGGSLEHEEMDFSANRRDGSARQKIAAHDNGFPMARGRVDAEMQEFGARFDLGWSDGDWGDVSGPMFDLELTLRYDLDLRTAGYFVAVRMRF